MSRRKINHSASAVLFPLPTLPPSAVTIYCDGACWPNPGPGAFGAIIMTPDGETEFSEFEAKTTNNRQELLGAIVPLESLADDSVVTVYSDSEYVVKGASKWVYQWIAKKKLHTMKNPDLWGRIVTQNARLTIHWRWVRGHSGNVGNERADRLAAACMEANGVVEDGMNGRPLTKYEETNYECAHMRSIRSE